MNKSKTNKKYALIALITILLLIISNLRIKTNAMVGINNEKNNKLIIKSDSQVEMGYEPVFNIRNTNTNEDIEVKVTNRNGYTLMLADGEYVISPLKLKENTQAQTREVKIKIPHRDENGKLHKTTILDIKTFEDKAGIPIIEPDKGYTEGENPNYKDKNLVSFDSGLGFMIKRSQSFLDYTNIYTKEYKIGERIDDIPMIISPEGLEFIGWSYNGRIYNEIEIKRLRVSGDMYFKAEYRPTVFAAKFIYGYPDATFRPNNPITRAEMGAIISRISKAYKVNVTNDKINYSDVSESAWYYEELKYLSNFNIFTGYPDGTFKPEGNITYNEFFIIIQRLTESIYRYNHIKWGDNLADYMNTKGYMENVPTGWNGDDQISREAVVQILNNVLEMEHIPKGKIYLSDIKDSYAKEAIERAVFDELPGKSKGGF